MNLPDIYLREWLRNTADPVEAEALRQLLAARKALRAVRVWIANENSPMRDTDRRKLRLRTISLLTQALKQDREKKP